MTEPIPILITSNLPVGQNKILFSLRFAYNLAFNITTYLSLNKFNLINLIQI